MTAESMLIPAGPVFFFNRSANDSRHDRICSEIHQ